MCDWKAEYKVNNNKGKDYIITRYKFHCQNLSQLSYFSLIPNPQNPKISANLTSSNASSDSWDQKKDENYKVIGENWKENQNVMEQSMNQSLTDSRLKRFKILTGYPINS